MTVRTPVPASQPAPPPQARPFQPGVSIDWHQPAIYVQTHVVLRSGPLEFLACWPGKEHESILRFAAAAEHIYLALGLIGVHPGHPPVWNEQTRTYDPPSGDLVDISVRWHAGSEPRTTSAFEWLREVEYERPPLPRPWYFAGSLRTHDERLSAGESGVGIALVDFPDSLIAYSRRFPSRYGALWAAAQTPAIPPLNTPVLLVIRPAHAHKLDVKVDRLGAIYVNGRYSSPADLADLIKLNQQLIAEYTLDILLHGTLHADQRRLHQALIARGVAPSAVRFIRPPASANAQDDADGGSSP